MDGRKGKRKVERGDREVPLGEGVVQLLPHRWPSQGGKVESRLHGGLNLGKGCF